MAELTFKSAGVSAREIDLSGPTNSGLVGTPAGVIGTANQGAAFVPITVGSFADFKTIFGKTDGEKFGPLAAQEWLRFAPSLTYLRVLGVGLGERRLTTGANVGRVESAGFVVGEQQPQDTGNFGRNTYAVNNGEPGRTYFLGCYMSQSINSTIFSDAGIQTLGVAAAHPIIRGVLMAASGVIPRLSSSLSQSAAPSAVIPASAAATSLQGFLTGSVTLLDGTNSVQEFVMILNGHLGTDSAYPNVLTASFDPTAPNYFASVLNKDPFKIEKAGYVLYSNYDVYPAMAVVTGTGILSATAISTPTRQESAFLLTGSAARNTGSAEVPNYECFENRFATPKTPFVISQRFGGNPVNLFRIHSLSDGAGTNNKWKVSIENIAPSADENNKYGKFDLVLRDIDDTDDSKIIIESYRGLSLNPSDDRFIAKAIGDMYRFFDFDRANGSQRVVVDGEYPNISLRIRIEVTDAIKNGDVDPEALPFGFRGHTHLVTSGSRPMAAHTSGLIAAAQADVLKRIVEPPVPFRKNIVMGVSPKQIANKNLYWGVQFEQQVSADELNKSRLSDKTIRSMGLFYPQMLTTVLNMAAGNNNGTSAISGSVLDADVFNRNMFSLENIQVVTASNAKADLKTLTSWEYVRAGNIVANATNKTRAFSVDDLDILGVRSLAKFSFFLEGGFDGVNIFNKNENDLNNRAVFEEMSFTARGQDDGPTVRSYKKSLEVMGITSEVDINVLAIPGIRHSVVTDSAIITSEGRFDAIYIMDVEERDTLNTVITSSIQEANVQNTVNAFVARNLDSNFAAAYYPDLVVNDPTTNTNVRVPPSVGVLGAFALNDSVGFPWFAPAGFTRGIMSNVQETVVKLNQDNLDDLYEAKVNPITAFPGGPGVVVWGQKTLQAAASSLDRVNVRRLLLELRRRVREVAKGFIFEPNREETLARFSSRVNPVLQRIQEQSGVNRYRVRIDNTTTTEADVLNNTIRGKIFVEPTRTTEFVSIDFVITNNGATVS